MIGHKECKRIITDLKEAWSMLDAMSLHAARISDKSPKAKKWLNRHIRTVWYQVVWRILWSHGLKQHDYKKTYARIETMCGRVFELGFKEAM